VRNRDEQLGLVRRLVASLRGGRADRAALS